jgi:hypothetical protein
MPTPIDLAAAFAQGYSTPPAGMDPELYHELRQKYIGLLNEVSIAETQLQKDITTSYGSMYASLISARANFLSAIAEGAKAGAMSQQAAADALKVWDESLEKSQQILLLQPPDEAMKPINTVVATHNQTVVADIASGQGAGQQLAQQLRGIAKAEGLGLPDEANPRGSGVYGAIAQHLAGNQMDASLIANTAIEQLNTQAMSQTQRLATGKATTDAILWSNYTAAKSYTEAAGLAVADEALWAMAESLSAPAVQKVEAAAGWGDPAAVAMFKQEQNQALDNVNYYKEQVAKLATLGIPAQYLQEMERSLGEMEGLVAGGPEVYGQQVMSMPTPDGTTLGKQMILAELAGLEQALHPEDPFKKGLADMRAVPGFELWAHAMGFPGVTRAALYASRHPHEFYEGVKLIQSGVTDPREIRQQLSEKGREEGRGFFVSPLGRIFAPLIGRRRPGFASLNALDEARRRLEAYTPSKKFAPFAAPEEPDLLDERRRDLLVEEEVRRTGAPISAETPGFAEAIEREAPEAEAFTRTLTPEQRAEAARKEPGPADLRGGHGKWRLITLADGMEFIQYEDGTLQVLDGRGLLAAGTMFAPDSMGGRELADEVAEAKAPQAWAEVPVETGDVMFQQPEKAALAAIKQPLVPEGIEPPAPARANVGALYGGPAVEAKAKPPAPAPAKPEEKPAPVQRGIWLEDEAIPVPESKRGVFVPGAEDVTFIYRAPTYEKSYAAGAAKPTSPPTPPPPPSPVRIGGTEAVSAYEAQQQRYKKDVLVPYFKAQRDYEAALDAWAKAQSPAAPAQP